MGNIVYVCNGFNPIEEQETLNTLKSAYPEMEVTVCSNVDDINFAQTSIKGVFIEASTIKSFINLLSNLKNFSNNYQINIRFLCSPFGLNYIGDNSGITINSMFETAALKEILSNYRVKILNSFSRFPEIGSLIGPSGVFKLNCLSSRRLLNPEVHKLSNTRVPSNNFYFNLITSTNRRYHLSVLSKIATYWCNRESNRDYEDMRNHISLHIITSPDLDPDILEMVDNLAESYPVTVDNANKVRVIKHEIPRLLYDNRSDKSMNHLYKDNPGYLLYLNTGSVFHEDIIVSQSYGNILITLNNNYLPHANHSIKVDYSNSAGELGINVCKMISKAVSGNIDRLSIAKSGKSYSSINSNVPSMSQEILEDFIKTLLDSTKQYDLQIDE